MARAYKVHGFGYTRFAASQGEARSVRMALAEEHGLKKNDIEVEETEVPTSKADLLPFLNELAERLDPKGGEESGKSWVAAKVGGAAVLPFDFGRAGLDVMVDLETRGNKPGCQIVSIGAVYFDHETGELSDEMYVVVNQDGQEELGLHEDHDTMAWWAKQSKEAREALETSTLNEGAQLEDALEQLKEFLSAPGLPDVRVWGNGSDFDAPILTVAYMACQEHAPWNFWNSRCFRLLKSMLPSIKMSRSGTAHNALDDARTQAEHACKLIAAMRGE